MFVEKFGVSSIFPFSARGICSSVAEIGFERAVWLAASVGGLGWGDAQPLCLLVSLGSLPLASARLKECLLWHVAGTAVFPA